MHARRCQFAAEVRKYSPEEVREYANEFVSGISQKECASLRLILELLMHGQITHTDLLLGVQLVFPGAHRAQRALQFDAFMPPGVQPTMADFIGTDQNCTEHGRRCAARSTSGGAVLVDSTPSAFFSRLQQQLLPAKQEGRWQRGGELNRNSEAICNGEFISHANGKDFFTTLRKT